MFAYSVLIVTMSFRKMSGVDPVTCPPFAVSRRFKKSINQLFIGPRIGVADELVDLFRRCRKPGQIVCHPPNQCPTIRFGRGRQAIFLQFRLDEFVNSRSPRRSFRGVHLSRTLRTNEWLERP